MDNAGKHRDEESRERELLSGIDSEEHISWIVTHTKEVDKAKLQRGVKEDGSIALSGTHSSISRSRQQLSSKHAVTKLNSERLHVKKPW